MKKFQKLLSEFVSIPSVSTDISFKKGIDRAANWLVAYAKQSDMQVKKVVGFGNPIIIASTKKDQNLKTILVYGHYDVQPANKKDGWKTNPFSLTLNKGRLYGRGSADNKGQILTHLYSVAKLIKEKRLIFNVIFLIEGNEETGSPNFRKGLEKNLNNLRCDCVVISDGGLGTGDSPALEASFRGSMNMEVSLTTAKDDLHSGLFGGIVPNAAEELSLLISKLHDKNKRVLVPGFYDDIKKQKVLAGGNEINLRKLTGTKKVFARNESEYEIKTGLEPAIEVTGISSGYTDVGFRNSVPAKSIAKINVRFAPEQKPKRLIKLLQKFIKENVPDYTSVTITLTDTAPGANLDMKNEFAKRATSLLRTVYKTNPTTKNVGGTLPIVNDLKQILKVPQVMIPLANEDCGMHSASENIKVNCVKKGLAFSSMFFGK